MKVFKFNGQSFYENDFICVKYINKCYKNDELITSTLCTKNGYLFYDKKLGFYLHFYNNGSVSCLYFDSKDIIIVDILLVNPYFNCKADCNVIKKENKEECSLNEILERACYNPITLFAMLLAFLLYVPFCFISSIIHFLYLFIKETFIDLTRGGQNDKNDN